MKLSLRWTIILGSIFLVWCTNLIITPISYLMTKNVLQDHMQDILTNISEQSLEKAYNFLDKARSAASIDKQLLGSNVVSSEFEETSGMERYFFDQLNLYPHLSSIYIGGLNGNFFMVGRENEYDPKGFLTMIIRQDRTLRATKLIWRDSNFVLFQYEDDIIDPYDPRTRPWFKNVIQHRHIIWTDPYIFYSSNKPGVTIAGPIFDQGDNIRAIVGVDIELAELSTFIRKLKVGKTGRAFILHRNGDIIAYPDPGKLIVQEGGNKDVRLPRIQEIGDTIALKSFESVDWQHDEANNLLLTEPTTSSFEHNGRKYLSMFTPFPETDLPWIIGVYLPEDDFLAEIKTNQLYIIIATIVFTILGSIIGFLLARKITRPVTELAKAAKEIETLNIGTPFSVRTVFKEIQETADSFSRMKTALTENEAKLKESETIYRAITNAANDAIIMFNEENEITFFNPAAETMFGYSNEDIIGSNITRLLSKKREDELYLNAIYMFMKDDTYFFRDRTVTMTGISSEGYEIPVELSLSKLQLEGRWHGVAIIRNITERIKAAQLRKRLVNDLHDGIGGSITNIKLLAEMSRAHEIPPQTATNLEAIADISQDCINEIRNYMNILDDQELSWKSFTAELHQYCAKTLEPHRIDFTMKVDIQVDASPPTTLLYMNVFKIIKEALNNVIKHSDCDTVELQSQIKDDRAEWILQDNGSGANKIGKGGRGILSMLSRTRELNGRMDISRENGYRISLVIPFTQITVRKNSLQRKT